MSHEEVKTGNHFYREEPPVPLLRQRMRLISELWAGFY